MKDGVLRPDIKRLCGTRKLGHLYLIGLATIEPCHVLPFPLVKCPVCGHGIKPFRGIRFEIDPELLFGDACKNATIPNQSSIGHLHCEICAVCSPKFWRDFGNKFALTWVNSRYYSPETFYQEAYRHGVCLQISKMPRQLINLKWEDYPKIFLAHRKACNGQPGIFMSFGPVAVQKLVPEDISTEEVNKLINAGIEPVIVKKKEAKHQPQPVALEVLVNE